MKASTNQINEIQSCGEFAAQFDSRTAPAFFAGGVVGAKRNAGTSRLRIWVAKYEAGSFDSDVVAAARLRLSCHHDRLRLSGGHPRRLVAPRGRLPPPCDACEKVGTRVSSLSLVRYRRNDYSVPTSFGHREVIVRGYVHEVVIACGTEAIASHPRSYEREDFIFDPLHYLALIEQKINALDQAAPLADWKLPEEFATLRRLLEARMSRKGKREFVQVLRLMETFRIEDVTAAVVRSRVTFGWRRLAECRALAVARDAWIG